MIIIPLTQGGLDNIDHVWQVDGERLPSRGDPWKELMIAHLWKNACTRRYLAAGALDGSLLS